MNPYIIFFLLCFICSTNNPATRTSLIPETAQHQQIMHISIPLPDDVLDSINSEQDISTLILNIFVTFGRFITDKNNPNHYQPTGKRLISLLCKLGNVIKNTLHIARDKETINEVISNALNQAIDRLNISAQEQIAI